MLHIFLNYFYFGILLYHNTLHDTKITLTTRWLRRIIKHLSIKKGANSICPSFYAIRKIFPFSDIFLFKAYASTNLSVYNLNCFYNRLIFRKCSTIIIFYLYFLTNFIYHFHSISNFSKTGILSIKECRILMNYEEL